MSEIIKAGTPTKDIVDAAVLIETTARTQEDLILRGLIDQINALLASDDVSLDELQELVDYIKANRGDIDSLGIAGVAGLQAALDGKLSVDGNGDVVVPNDLHVDNHLTHDDAPDFNDDESSVNISMGKKLFQESSAQKLEDDFLNAWQDTANNRIMPVGWTYLNNPTIAKVLSAGGVDYGELRITSPIQTLVRKPGTSSVVSNTRMFSFDVPFRCIVKFDEVENFEFGCMASNSAIKRLVRSPEVYSDTKLRMVSKTSTSAVEEIVLNNGTSDVDLVDDTWYAIEFVPHYPSGATVKIHDITNNIELFNSAISTINVWSLSYGSYPGFLAKTKDDGSTIGHLYLDYLAFFEGYRRYKF